MNPIKMNPLSSLLKDYELRSTKFRLNLLELFTNSDSSLTVEDIKQKIGKKNDKVTIYRALDSFEKKGLIHQVPDQENLTRYALCLSECNAAKHIHNHAHFICIICSNTFCIENIKFPKIKDLNGFIIKNLELTLKGNCPKCSKK